MFSPDAFAKGYKINYWMNYNSLVLHGPCYRQ